MRRFAAALALSLGLRSSSSFTAAAPTASTALVAQYNISVSSTDPYTLTVKQGDQSIVESIGILAGGTAADYSYTAAPISASAEGEVSGNGGAITTDFVTPTVAKIQINSSSAYVGAQFSGNSNNSLFYGVWEYPWDGHVANGNVSFEIKGLQEMPGVNYCNARSPFFVTNAGYGVYIDTLAMGTFDFTMPGSANFIFNSSALSIYVILPDSTSALSPYKSILSQYGNLSSYIYMPPDSAYGPIIYSDNWEEDFHGNVTNAQENYFDAINHLRDNHIRATALFADRPYGTGNGSWGNFDFDPTFYPSSSPFISNLSASGFDFQVWIANRATPATELFNVSSNRSWLFDYDPSTIKGGLAGPALNLSIPDAYGYFRESLDAFTDVGVKGYKIDRGEEGEMPVWVQNEQMGLFQELAWENMAAKWGAGNFFTFSRSAVDRARSHTAVWNGDSAANWTGLQYSVASGIRAGVIGFSMWGSDTGGYTRKGDPGQTPTEDVWARWMHVAAWSPMYEIMLGTGNTPWYPPFSRDLVDVFRETAALHASLMPYIKSYTHVAATEGLPVVRALWLEEPDDAKAWGVGADDSYFFGAELLVAPIVAPGGARDVYFPGDEEVKFLEFFGKNEVRWGGTTARVQGDLHFAPVYVREGAIVPTGDIYRGNAVGWVDDWEPFLEVQVFPSFDVDSSSFAFFNGVKGEVVEIRLTTDRESGSATVEYGDLGYNGTVVFWTTDGAKNVSIVKGGGTAVVEGIASLFDEQEA